MSDTAKQPDPYVTVKVPRAIHGRIKKLGEKNHRSVMGEVAYALDQYIEANAHLVAGLLDEEPS